MRKYDDEFKREAVRKVFDGQSVASVNPASKSGVTSAILRYLRG